MDAIQEFLDEQTKKDRSGEVHEEFAIHDFEGFPHRFYSEYMGEKDFETLYDAIDIAKEHNLPLSVLLEAASDLGYEDNIERVAEESYKSLPVSMGNEFRDLAMEIVADGGMESVSNPKYYFDYEEYGHDVRQDYSEEEIAENGWDKLDDEELGMELIEMTGGFENLSEETIDSYFDYSRYGRDLEHDYIAVRGDDGYVYFFNRNFAKGGKFAKGGEVAKSNKQMVQSKAKEVMHHAKELQDAIKKESDIEAWVVSKVQRASTDLSDVTHYLDGRTEYGEGGTLAGNLDVDNVGFGLKHANGGETAISDSEKKASLKNNLKLKL